MPDQIDMMSHLDAAAINADFDRLKAQVAEWLPEPAPPRPPRSTEAPLSGRIPYLDEVPLTRGWFR